MTLRTQLQESCSILRFTFPVMGKIDVNGPARRPLYGRRFPLGKV
ncbi:hypothetical protein [Arthrobacter sp. 2MCAF14]